MEPIVIVEGEDLARLLDHLDIARKGPRPYRLRFAIDGGIKIKANEEVWTINLGRVEVPGQAVSRDLLAQDIRELFQTAPEQDRFDTGARWALRALAGHLAGRLYPDSEADRDGFVRDALRVETRADS